MIKKEEDHSRGGWSQFVSWALFFVVGLIFSILVSFALSYTWYGSTRISMELYTVGYIRVSQVVGTLIMFLAPAFLHIHLNHGNVVGYLKLKEKTSWQYIIIATLMIIAIQPLVSMLGHYNQNIQLPEALLSWEEFFKSSTESTNKILQLFFSDKSILGLIINIVIVAGLAAFAEEIFFRGCLQPIIQRITKNIHLAVWITAIIFSAIHFDFYGFVPRILLGAVLGYFFVYTNNLWVPILVHFLNNTMAVILEYVPVENGSILDNFDPEKDFVYVIGSVIITSFLFILLIRKDAQNKYEKV